MKIFISWSGERSRIIAEGLNEWLPNIFQYIEVFYSPAIEKGTKGSAEINANLEGTSFGIICLTAENLQNNWIHYEAGALAKINDDNTRVWTLLIGLSPSNVKQPLGQFQHTLAQKADIYKLLHSINKHLQKPLSEIALQRTFERWWSDFEDKIKEAENLTNETQTAENIRPDREILDEILDILRTNQRFKNTSQLIHDIVAENNSEILKKVSAGEELKIILSVKHKESVKLNGRLLKKIAEYFFASELQGSAGETEDTTLIKLTLPTYIPSSIFFQEFEKGNQDWGLDLTYVDWMPTVGSNTRFNMP